VLPESFSRPMAVPEGLALIGLGVSLWRDQRPMHTASTTGPATNVATGNNHSAAPASSPVDAGAAAATR